MRLSFKHFFNVILAAILYSANAYVNPSYRSLSKSKVGIAYSRSSFQNIKSTKMTLRSLDESMNRRSLLVTSALSIIINHGKTTFAADSTAQIVDGLLQLSNQAPYEDRTIALFSDGSAIFSSFEEALKKVGATVVKIDAKKSVKQIHKEYFENNCYSAVVPDSATVKKIMQDEGCECERYRKGWNH